MISLMFSRSDFIFKNIEYIFFYWNLITENTFSNFKGNPKSHTLFMHHGTARTLYPENHDKEQVRFTGAYYNQKKTDSYNHVQTPTDQMITL